MMIRKFKLAGVLLAVACAFAVTASSASATFTSAAYPATASGATTDDAFDAFGSTTTCTHNTYQVHQMNAASQTITVTPSFTSCSGGGLPKTVNFTGCDFVFHSPAAPNGQNLTVDLVCPEGVTGVDITLYSSSSHATSLCHKVMHPFTGMSGLTATNSGSHILIQGTIQGITMTQERTNFLCPAGTHTTTAKYTIQPAGITLIGSNGAFSVS